jgi:branched-chain amino acid transport system substrate-binding protein
LPLGKWAAENYGKTGYTAVADYIPGHDAEGAFIKGFTDGGGKLLGSVRFPFNNPDYTPFLQRVKDAHPKVAFLWPPGGTQAVAMMNVARDLKLRENGIEIVSTQDLLPDEELPNMGELPVGLITSGNYSTAATRPANLAFLAAWKKAYGDKFIPDYMSVGAWDGMAAIFTVIKETKGNFTGDQAMAILSHWKNPDSPRGAIEIDPETRDIIQNVYIRRTEMKDGKLANVEFDTIPNVKDPWKELNSQKQ